MKTNNTISIHYIVQTQYVENENGEKVIFKKKFELENIPLARKNALDYYHTALDYQHEEKEICTKKNGQIIYKHPENYDRGYAFYISICENEKSVLHLLDAHYDLDIAEQKKVNAGRSLEKKLYRQMNLQFERNTYLNLMMSKYTTVQINLIDQLKSL
ncbi:MAG: hypothetical protein KBS61_05440, partial [Chryseobacterium sp.]|nr:hypothetical protein [Candidatus Chryseobacterium enterohippi]